MPSPCGKSFARCNRDTGIMLRADERLDAIEAAAAARLQADNSVRDLIALILDPDRFAEHCAALESSITTALADIAAMDSELSAFDSQAGDRRAKIDADHEAINAAGDLDQLIGKEAALKARRDAIEALKMDWRVFGESDEVFSGFREPLFAALVKARRAHDEHGSLPVGDGDPHFPTEEGQVPAWQAPAAHRDALARVFVQETIPAPPRDSVVVRRRNRRADFNHRGIRK
jgi:hypothetical protein